MRHCNTHFYLAIFCTLQGRKLNEGFPVIGHMRHRCEYDGEKTGADIFEVEPIWSRSTAKSDSFRSNSRQNLSHIGNEVLKNTQSQLL